MGVRRRLPINKYVRETTERENEKQKKTHIYILNMHLHDSSKYYANCESKRTSAVCSKHIWKKNQEWKSNEEHDNE